MRTVHEHNIASCKKMKRGDPRLLRPTARLTVLRASSFRDSPA
ncbi:hypothetical protein EM6_2169 [Asticcacaulis excentricus]|uniref:Uncharacterized protein n=1 Tax=Asticcacaulis excentricus TaxID=78587 RepID=A0A3G9G480_9CAUL|nr:hypothetical protein EM6_2169 [Asticcacaulis excentricus]